MKTKRNYMTIALIAMIFGVFSMSNAVANEPAKKMNVVEIASSDAQFSILVEAVVKAELVDALSADGPYTVFAPTNDAFNALFEKLGVDGIGDLSRDQLTPILLYHVVSGKVMAADVKSGSVPTLNDKSDLEIMVSDGGVKINKTSKVVVTDIEATNGVIHVIDNVLVPEKKKKASSSSAC